MKPKVYLETTVISYLTARPNRDLIVAANQQMTYDWWHEHRDNYDLFASQTVIDEARVGDPIMAQARLAILDKLPLLDETVEVETLAKMLVDKGPLPMKATVDAAHIAIAAFYGMDYLLTWNCKHIANARMWPGVAMICRRHGYEPPFICTPAELLGV